ncbi:hypothetical protein [Chitinophaga tropicalis]|uniref:Uncharacterized protein n=1 Tax=Chitinophaga tropicalis TaxID=2683588 RepID=A0A7K1U625_9BACT|nr:hypothetical protein [Chitinophaga tropicalis]MVT09807.1 hypothetical protein [Chitinophaga tropicalis]
MNKFINHPFLDEESLKSLPVTYRLIRQMNTADVGELYNGARYGSSRRHFSRQFMMQGPYKPLSEVLYQQYIQQPAMKKEDDETTDPLTVK